MNDALRASAYRYWEDIVGEVSARWMDVAEFLGPDAPWFDDEELQGAVREAFLSGDFRRTKAACDRWKARWLRVIAEAEDETPSRRWKRIRGAARTDRGEYEEGVL